MKADKQRVYTKKELQDHWDSPENQARVRELKRLEREHDETHQYKESKG